MDESLTSGSAYHALSRGCPPFSHLTLTGGAIGCGIPLALGAAVACPDRVVINLQVAGCGGGLEVSILKNAGVVRKGKLGGHQPRPPAPLRLQGWKQRRLLRSGAHAGGCRVPRLTAALPSSFPHRPTAAACTACRACGARHGRGFTL